MVEKGHFTELMPDFSHLSSSDFRFFITKASLLHLSLNNALEMEIALKIMQNCSMPPFAIQWEGKTEF